MFNDAALTNTTITKNKMLVILPKKSKFLNYIRDLHGLGYM